MQACVQTRDTADLPTVSGSPPLRSLLDTATPCKFPRGAGFAQAGHVPGNLFPVPVHFVAPEAARGWPRAQQRHGRQPDGAAPRAERAAPPAPPPSPNPYPREACDGPHGAALQPVFRVAPYRAEAARRRAGGTAARLLFVDEGNHCRCAMVWGGVWGVLGRRWGACLKGIRRLHLAQAVLCSS